jgi:ADP-ribosylglycohydrolase
MKTPLLGALIGDAIGASLEFYDEDITYNIAKNALKMSGGGALRIGPGQITDDGELTLALWRILHLTNTSDFPMTYVIQEYIKWYKSKPFDIGSTCLQAFIKASKYIYLEKYIKEISDINQESEANGALMRCTPIPLWYSRYSNISYIDIGLIAMKDAQISHPNIICQEVNAIYCIAIYLLLNGNTPVNTIKVLDTYINIYITSAKVKQWYFEESIDISFLDCKTNCGHVRYGFVLAIYFLRNSNISYEDAIISVLMKGGDTDTNCAIVGGLVGTYQDIPDNMIYSVMNFDCCIEGRIRPKEYGVKYVLDRFKL